MATSTCSKCGNTSFEMKETDVHGSRFKLMFIQCRACGAVVGIQDYYNTGQLINDLASKLHVSLDK